MARKKKVMKGRVKDAAVTLYMPEPNEPSLLGSALQPGDPGWRDLGAEQYARENALVDASETLLRLAERIAMLDDAVDAILEYLEVDLVPAEEVMPRGAYVAIERSEKGEDEDAK